MKISDMIFCLVLWKNNSIYADNPELATIVDTRLNINFPATCIKTFRNSGIDFFYGLSSSITYGILIKLLERLLDDRNADIFSQSLENVRKVMSQ